MCHPLVCLSALALALSACATPPASDYHVANRFALPDGKWDYASVDPVLHRLYVARGDGVSVIDLETGAVTGKLVPASGSHEALPLSNGTVLLVTNGATGIAQFVDARTGAEIASVKVGKGPDAAVLDPTSGLVAVMNHAGGTITLIDPQTHTAVGEIEVGGTLEFAVLDGAGHLFVNDEDGAAVAVVDIANRRLVKRIQLGACEGPTGLAYLPVSKRLLAACDNDLAAVINPATQAFERTLAIGSGPDAVIYDHVRKLAFIPAGTSADLTVFADEATGIRKTGKITTQSGARTGAVDEATGKVYLPAALYDPPTAAGERQRMKPGTVVVLEIAP